MQKGFSQWLQGAWYNNDRRVWPLLPLSWLVAAVARLRLLRFRSKQLSPAVPVLVVGNITVGGTGKTPLVVSLCEYFLRHNKRVVVISRGYGAAPAHYPFAVEANHDASVVGDEPLLIAQRTGVPVIIDPRRKRALDMAISQFNADIVISDDGLQHYALPRTAEVLVLDGERMYGNGYCLPAGPLREPVARAKEVNWRVVNGRPERGIKDAVVMSLSLADPVNVRSGESMPMEDFVARFPFVKAVAGIGNPQRFFSALMAQGLVVEPHPFKDHHVFSQQDFDSLGAAVVLMTEKDAVKCSDLVGDDAWYVPVAAQLPTVFFDSVFETLMRGPA
jgi:tetraacyldisaccharide 4'-kinase